MEAFSRSRLFVIFYGILSEIFDKSDIFNGCRRVFRERFLFRTVGSNGRAAAVLKLWAEHEFSIWKGDTTRIGARPVDLPKKATKACNSFEFAKEPAGVWRKDAKTDL